MANFDYTRRDLLRGTATAAVLPATGDVLSDDVTDQSVEALLGVHRLHGIDAAGVMTYRDVHSPEQEEIARVLGQSVGAESTVPSQTYDGGQVSLDGLCSICLTPPDAPDARQSAYDTLRSKLERYAQRYPDAVSRLTETSTAGYDGMELEATRTQSGKTMRISSLIQSLPWGLLIWDLAWDPSTVTLSSDVLTQHRQRVCPQLCESRTPPTLQIRHRWQRYHASPAEIGIITSGNTATLDESIRSNTDLELCHLNEQPLDETTGRQEALSLEALREV